LLAWHGLYGHNADLVTGQAVTTETMTEKISPLRQAEVFPRESMVDAFDSFFIVGDPHGCYEEFVALLAKAGFTERDDVWEKPSCLLVVSGDIIERGPHTPKLTRLIRRMWERGLAFVTNGNHEIDVILYNELKKRGVTEQDMPFSEPRKKLLAQVGLQYKNTYGFSFRQELADDLAFFSRLPVYAHCGEFRVVHACWDWRNIALLERCGTQKAIEFLVEEKIASIEARKSGSRLREISHEKSKNEAYVLALKKTVGGKVYNLHNLAYFDVLSPPGGYEYVDTRGQARHSARIKWWARNKEDIEKFSDILLVPEHYLASHVEKNPDLLRHFKEAWRQPFDPDPTPIIFGHYNRPGEPRLIDGTHLCLDFQNYLAGYLWHKGDTKLSAEQLIWVG
jgi:hypothetical protein